MSSIASEPVGILLIDDDRPFLEAIAELLRRAGYRTMTAGSGAEGLDVLRREASTIDMVLLDVRMPVMDGIETLEQIVRFHPTLPVIMLTGENAIDLVVRAVKTGAANYIYKGAPSGELLAAISAIAQKARSVPAPMGQERHGDLGVIGRSAAVRQLLADAEMCAATMISVLITGETGVGKDLLARAIHTMSQRAAKPFVAIDVPNIPSTMFESELFGHTRGAFTGATDPKQGLVQSANGGTVFLDEIGEFPIELHVPPLRERREDIAPLAAHFLQTFIEKNSMPVKRLSESAIALLERQRWPGNIRELRRAMEAVAVMTPEATVEHTDVARVLDRAAGDQQADVTVVRDYNDVQALARQTKKEELIRVLDRHGWNITKAATELDIDRSTLSKQMKSLGIDKPRLRL